MIDKAILPVVKKLKEQLTFSEEDVGLGAYEYAGSHGYDSVMAMVCDQYNTSIEISFPVSELSTINEILRFISEDGDKDFELNIENTEVFCSIESMRLDHNNFYVSIYVQ